MKKITLILILILTISCSVTNPKKSVPQPSLEGKIGSLEYELTLPTQWSPHLDAHNEVVFSPSYQTNKNFKVYIHIKKIPASEHNYISLKKIAKKQNEYLRKFLKIHSITINLNQSKFGETCVNKYSYSRGSKKIKLKRIYFKYKNNYYCFTYSSNESLFHKYSYDSKIIFNSLKFKE